MAIQNRKFGLAGLVLFGVVGMSTLPLRADAATLDTPPVLDPGSVTVYCLLTNLHATKTMNIDATSGLYDYSGSLVQAITGHADAGETATTGGAPANICSVFNVGPCHCHFSFTGVLKGKARGSYSSSVIVGAY